MGDGATSRRHHPNPAEAEWRWRGGGARRAGVKSAEPWVSRSAKTPHCFVPCSTKTVSQNQPLETAASKPVESPKSVSGDWLPTPEIARNRANSRVSQESKFEPGLVGWGTWIRTKIHEVRVRYSSVELSTNSRVISVAYALATRDVIGQKSWRHLAHVLPAAQLASSCPRKAARSAHSRVAGARRLSLSALSSFIPATSRAITWLNCTPTSSLSGSRLGITPLHTLRPPRPLLRCPQPQKSLSSSRVSRRDEVARPSKRQKIARRTDRSCKDSVRYPG